MELILIRHGKAEAHGHPLGDGERALVEKGRCQSRKVGWMLRRIGRVPEVVLTSPLLRTRQTADEVCQAAGIPGPVMQGWLACGMDPETAIRELVAFSDFSRVAMVGHEPDFSGLIEWLLGCSGSSVEVKKGCVTSLLVHPPAWHARLLYHVPPILLDAEQEPR